MARLTVFSVLLATAAATKELTPKDFDKEVFNSGKDSPVVGVYDVDCTAGGESLCQKYGVKGYPTIKYFTQKTGKNGAAYNGGRDMNALKSFIDSTFKANCDALTGKGCNELELKYIEKTKDKSAEELAEEKKLKEADLKALKKERSDAEAELAAKQKKWKSKEIALNKGLTLIKQFEKAQKDGSKKKSEDAPKKKSEEEL